MIPFFRKIRKKMANDNKPFKYMRYALGEIVLVVIGILIALQINNWNQERIAYEETRTLLSNLKFDVEADIDNLKDQKDALSQRKEWADLILKSLDERKTTDSTMFISALLRVGWIMDYSHSLPTYNEIVSSGKLSYIKSETLKKELTNYQTEFEDYRQIMSSYNLGLKETERLAIGYLTRLPEGSNLSNTNPSASYKGISFDLNTIADDTEFYKSVKHISFYTSVNIDFISRLLITKAEGLKNLIADEHKTYGS